MVEARQYLTVRVCILFQIILLCLQPSFVLAAEEQPATLWEIEADTITHEKKTDSILAEGAVVIRKHDEQTPDSMVIQADRIQYNTTLKTVRASGNLVISTNSDEITAQEALIDLGDQTGIFHKAVLYRAPINLYLTGAILQKTGDNAYWIKDGSLTTCTVPAGEVPPWSINSKDSQITPDGNARLKHVTFRVKKTPVVYVPYLLVPANRERKSGLLYPEISQSRRDGFGLLAPVFVNLAPYSDFTLYPGYLTNRGATSGAEFRYMADYESYGTLTVNYLNDRTVDTPEDDYNSDGILRTNHDRYWFRGKIDHAFSGSAFARLDLDLVSDRDYLQEYKKGLIGYKKSNASFFKLFHRGFQAETIPYRENTLQLTKRWTTMAVNTELLAVDDLIDDPMEQTSPWAVPRLLFGGATGLEKLPFDLSWNTEYTYYWRERGVVGHRLDLYPRLISPLPLSPYLEASAWAGLRETLYLTDSNELPSPVDWSGKRDQNRTMYDLKITAATTLLRDYTTGWKLLGGNRSSPAVFRHMFRPELEYTYTPSINQDDLPQYDATDRIPAVNWLRYKLNNYFKLSRNVNGTSSSRASGYFKIEQSYNRQEDRHPFSDLLFKFNHSSFNSLFLHFETALSMYGQGVTYYDINTTYNHRQKHKLGVRYRYLKHANIVAPYFFAEPGGDGAHQLNGSIASELTKTLAAEFHMEHSFTTNQLIDAALHLNYHPSCWALELVANVTPDDRSLMAIVSLEGIGGALKLGIPGL
jgi:LPS-assembly protein